MGLCKAVEIFRRQWEVTIIVTELDGSKTTWVASADRALSSDSIWLGTEDELKEALKRVMGS